MHFKSLALSLLAASVSMAQDNGNSTSGGDGNNKDLGALMAKLPQCAIPCFTSSAEDVGCSDTDFNCLCKTKSKEFVNTIKPCVLNSGECEIGEMLKAQSAANDFCEGVRNDPSNSQLAQATQVASSVFAAAATATDEPDAAARPAAGLGFAGIAVAAALAL